jgi:hypothetical protein
MVLLNWPPPNHLWIGRNRGKSCHPQRLTNIRASIAAEWPSCVSATPQLKRE